MWSLHTRALAAGCLLLVLAGCSAEEKPFRKVVVPVKGRITVDGMAPSTPIKIDCHNTGAADKEHPSASSGLTGDNGEFALSTYETGDGVPEGEYALTYFWGQFNLVSMSYGGKDQLKRKYLKPDDSITKFTAKDGSPIDLGEIKLTTK